VAGVERRYGLSHVQAVNDVAIWTAGDHRVGFPHPADAASGREEQ
jgi:hypothetical protein